MIKKSSTNNLSFWFKFSIFNLMIVALYGTIMRYKIGFEFPFLNQKFLQHAHSHFAFAGWISHVLITLMTSYLIEKIPAISIRKYKGIIIANMVFAYGMLIAFSFQGYAALSIAFSTASTLTAWLFAWFFITDIKKNKLQHPSVKWFKAALWFNIFSSLGAFYLGYMMATKNYQTDEYLMSVYYFLHFQYNGWFLFACLGLTIDRITRMIPTLKMQPSIFWLLCISCIPTYFLSVLWVKMPTWIYIIVIMAAFAQIIGWYKLVMVIKKNLGILKKSITSFSQFLFLYVALGFSIKLLLQLVSTIPFLSNLAFSFRSIVVAYLHLVLLAVISVFLITFMYSFNFIKNSRTLIIALAIFITGVFLNEVVLTIQGVASFSFTLIPFANEILFGIATLILLSMLLMTLSQIRVSKVD